PPPRSTLFPSTTLFRSNRELKLPTPRHNNPILVYLFEDRDHYERFMRARYPNLPMRRAFFVAQPRGMGGGDDLLVYTFLGDHLRSEEHTSELQSRSDLV